MATARVSHLGVGSRRLGHPVGTEARRALAVLDDPRVEELGHETVVGLLAQGVAHHHAQVDNCG